MGKRERVDVKADMGNILPDNLINHEIQMPPNPPIKNGHQNPQAQSPTARSPFQPQNRHQNEFHKSRYTTETQILNLIPSSSGSIISTSCTITIDTNKVHPGPTSY